jgi:AraC family transcriptional regulator
VKVVYQTIRPLTVLYARAAGPYATGTTEAWQVMGRWLDARNARPHMRVSYGLFRDNPRRVAAELLRYDACIPLVMGLEDDPDAGIHRQLLPGGAFAVYTHVGSLEQTGRLFSELYREEIPSRGMQPDDERPFLAVYRTDPTVTREQFQRTELCVPVLPLPISHANNDEEATPASPYDAPEVRDLIAMSWSSAF